jgi:hypothetical protein
MERTTGFARLERDRIAYEVVGEASSMGDGILATFDGPGRAIRKGIEGAWPLLAIRVPGQG